MFNKTKSILLLSLQLLFLCGFFASPAFAAIKCYSIPTSNTTVYSNTGLTTKYGAIYASDEITVNTVTDRYCKVTYPVSKGTKTGYIATSAILTATMGPQQTANRKITTYRRPGGSSYGYIAAGDSCKILGTYGNYRQVKYPVSGGYKYAFITNSDYNVGFGGQVNSGSNYTALSQALYKNSSAKITCGFDGYTTTSGRHEGIDMSLYNGAPIYALVSGTVVRVANGYNGSSGLSTIAIYDSTSNKTVIYLHSNPSVSTGQTISKGQQIGTQGWRGVSSASGSHTHVEVRNGKQGYASKSVNDYVLDNPNPTSYWQSKGYTIK